MSCGTMVGGGIVTWIMSPVTMMKSSGIGTLELTLMPDNKTVKTENGKKILIKGATFVAKFNVQTPAQQPTPAGPVPDPVAVKPGQAQFITTNTQTMAG